MATGSKAEGAGFVLSRGVSERSGGVHPVFGECARVVDRGDYVVFGAFEEGIEGPEGAWVLLAEGDLGEEAGGVRLREG